MHKRTILRHVLEKAYKKAKRDYGTADNWHVKKPNVLDMKAGKIINQMWWNGVLVAYMRLDKRYQELVKGGEET